MKQRWLLVGAAALMAACGGTSGGNDGGSDGGSADAAPDAGPALVGVCMNDADEAIIDAATYDGGNAGIPPTPMTGRPAVQGHSQACAILANDEGGCFDNTINVQGAIGTANEAAERAAHTACMAQCIGNRVGAISADCLTCFGLAATCATEFCSAVGDGSCVCLLGDQCCDDSEDTVSGQDCSDGSDCNNCIIDHCLADLLDCTGAPQIDFFTCDEPNDYCPPST